MSAANFGFSSLGEDDIMRAWDNASDLRNAALGKEISSHNFAEWEQEVSTDFWSKIRRFAGQLPFVEDVVAGVLLRARCSHAHARARHVACGYRLFHPAV